MYQKERNLLYDLTLNTFSTRWIQMSSAAMRVVEWKSSHRDDVRVFTFTHLFMLMYSHLEWLTLHPIRDAECLSWLVQSSSQIWRGLQHVNFIEDFIATFELSYWWKFQSFHPHTLKFSHFASNMSNHHDNDNFLLCSSESLFSLLFHII